jgi:putative transposase
MSTKEPILPGKYYHLYNHSNGNLNLFRNDENFRFFLEKYIKYVHPFVDTFAYCLMPNHFHFLVRVKEEVSKRSDLSERSERFERFEITPIQVTNAIKNWLISYTNSYHKVYGTRGNLYHQKIRRKIVSDDAYLLNLVGYIHLNPVIHEFTESIEDWEHSSYKEYLSNENSFIDRQQVFDLFGDKENFLYYHNLKKLERILKVIDLDF